MLAFDYGEPAPAHILGVCPFLIALRSPFSLSLSAVITPSTALWGKGYKTYSLFFNGLGNYSTPPALCQGRADIFLSVADMAYFSASRISLQSRRTKWGFSSEASRISRVVSPLRTSMPVIPAARPDLISV